MKMLTAKIVDGRVDIPKGLLEEGSTVTVLVQEPDEAFDLSESQRQELSQAIAEADRGEVSTAGSFLRASAVLETPSRRSADRGASYSPSG